MIFIAGCQSCLRWMWKIIPVAKTESRVSLEYSRKFPTFFRRCFRRGNICLHFKSVILKLNPWNFTSDMSEVHFHWLNLICDCLLLSQPIKSNTSPESWNTKYIYFVPGCSEWRLPPPVCCKPRLGSPKAQAVHGRLVGEHVGPYVRSRHSNSYLGHRQSCQASGSSTGSLGSVTSNRYQIRTILVHIVFCDINFTRLGINHYHSTPGSKDPV